MIYAHAEVERNIKTVMASSPELLKRLAGKYETY